MAGTAAVVIGSAFGDEGKGLITDVLCSRSRPEDTLVVRFNGGAQAGHTVVTPEGQRHVFSHFGSGSFIGAATYLSRFFAVNPVLFHPEARHLHELGLAPRLLIDRRAMVTTPFDMAVNTLLEQKRGAARHGSCGAGFGETVGRHEAGFTLTAGDLTGAAGEVKLRAIRDSWLPQRLAAAGIALPPDERAALLSEGLLARFMDDAARLLDRAALVDEQVLAGYSHRVLEGAQGLLLDQDMGFFPHVTRSHTGLRNAGVLLKAAGAACADVYYVLRPYVTRHGAGPLPGEILRLPYPGFEDKTNRPNPWQGTLRFALADITRLQGALKRDAGHAQLPAGLHVHRHLAVTCLDQVGDEVRFLEDGVAQAAAPDEFVQRCLRACGVANALVSYAPERSGCRELGARAWRRSVARAGCARAL